MRHRDFALLLIGQSVSRFGDRIYAIALPFQMFALGASPIELGVAAAILDASHLLFVLVGGAVADRFPRRVVILASDLVAGLSVTALALLSWSGQIQIAHVYVISAVFGAAEAFLAPAYGAIIPELVPNDVLQAGNAARSLSRSVARIAGPAVGGIAVVAGGPALGFGIDALTFFFSFTTLLFVRARPPRTARREAGLISQVRDGFAYTLGLRWVVAGALGYALLNIAYSGQSSVVMPLLVREIGGDAGTLGALNATFGGGAVIAGLFLARATLRHVGTGIYAFELVAAVAVVLMGVLANAPSLTVLMLVIGIALTGSDVAWQTALQRHIRSEMRGRVGSIASLAIYALNPLAPLLAGAIVQTVGPTRSLTALGLYAAIVATALLFASPLRRLR